MNKFKEKLRVESAQVNGKKLPDMYNVYDKDKQYLGKINQDYEKKQNNWLKGVCVFLETENGKIIMEHRGNTKLNPNEDDYCSGHVDENETSIQAVYREMEEELGLSKEKVTNLTKILEAIPLEFAKRKFFIQFFYAKIKSKDIMIDNKEVESFYEEEKELAFKKLRQGKTKFPYKGNEETFEKLIQEVEKVREISQKDLDEEEIK